MKRLTGVLAVVIVVVMAMPAVSGSTAMLDVVMGPMHS